MIALKVEDVKTFTSKLFLKEDFDSFLDVYKRQGYEDPDRGH